MAGLTVLAILAFFAAVFGLARVLRLRGTALAVVVVTGLLALALVLQATIGTPIFAGLALALTLAAAALRWAFDVAAWRSERRPPHRRPHVAVIWTGAWRRCGRRATSRRS